jgi:hypothetical protein
VNLEEAILMRSNELTRILAGCVAIDPPRILPMLKRLKPEAFTDQTAKKYIFAMQEQLEELQAADEARQIAIGIEIAKNFNFLPDYCIWITAVSDLILQAETCVKELQGLAITLHTIGGLQDWIDGAQKEINL